LFDHLVHAGADHLEIVEVIQMAAFDTRPGASPAVEPQRRGGDRLETACPTEEASIGPLVYRQAAFLH
jgi:hypothetical protein